MFRPTIRAVLLFALLDAGRALAGAPNGDLLEGRSAADRCDRNVEVCGVMGPDRLVPFVDRCAAQDAGAQRIIVGPCFDEN